MSPIFTNLSEIATSLFQSIRLSFIIPSFIFWSLNVLFIYDVLPASLKEFIRRLINTFSLDTLSLITILSFVSGYFLFVLNTPIIRWFEGYPWSGYVIFQKFCNFKIRYHRNLHKTLVNNYEIHLKEEKRLRSELYLSERCKGDSGIEEQSNLRLQISETKINQTWFEKKIQNLYPVSTLPFLPTRLGNAMASFEDYPYEKYQIDSVILWPRFLPVLSQVKYSLYLEREKANLDLLINLCLVAILFSIESFFVGIIYGEEISGWLILIGFTLCVVYFLYIVAIGCAIGWGTTVRVAFDLYRYELLASLKIKLPVNRAEEDMIWMQTSSHFRDYKTNNSLNVDYNSLNLTMLNTKSQMKAEEANEQV